MLMVLLTLWGEGVTKLFPSHLIKEHQISKHDFCFGVVNSSTMWQIISVHITPFGAVTALLFKKNINQNLQLDVSKHTRIYEEHIKVAPLMLGGNGQ